MGEASGSLRDSRIGMAGDRDEGLSMPDREKACQCLSNLRGRLSGTILSTKEHGMGCQDTNLYCRAGLIDARGTLATMDDLAGGETNCVQILRAAELAREDSCLGPFRRDEVNIVRPNHDDY